MEKQAIETPPATGGERKLFGMRTVLLTSWATVATALFVIVLIGGAVYLNDVRSMCDNGDGSMQTKTDDGTGETKTDKSKDGDETEELYLDKDQQTQLFIKRNKDGAIILIADVDYKKKISATYIAGGDLCYLSKGEDMDWYTAWNAPKLSDRTNSSEEGANELQFKVDADNRVTDMSLLPTTMRPFCEGKQIYWMTPTEETDGSRKKRAVACWRVCYHGYYLWPYGYGSLCYYYDCYWRWLATYFYY